MAATARINSAWTALFAVLLAAPLLSPPARALLLSPTEEGPLLPTPPQTYTMNALDFARGAIASGNGEAARPVLDAFLKAHPDDVEANFLLATLDAGEGKLDEAIARYRKILLDHPDLVRVRLDYALALFRQGEDDQADYNFRLALDADLPDVVRANVMSYLHAIRARVRFKGSITASLAPDTNINAGTSVSQIAIFGLPFTPSLQIEKKSGIGATVAVAGDDRYPITDTLRWRSVANFWRTEYPGGQFDDMIARFEAGPEMLRQDWDVSTLGVYTQRWYGNDPFLVGAGSRVETVYNGFERWRIESDVEYQRLGFHSQTQQNGNYVSVDLYPDLALPPTAILHPILGYFREIASDPAFGDGGVRVGLGYHQELPHALTVELQGEVYFSYFDAPNILYGTTRRDQTLRLEASLYRRDWIVFGLDPVLSVIYTRNASNQAIYAYRREQLELGFTKEF